MAQVKREPIPFAQLPDEAVVRAGMVRSLFGEIGMASLDRFIADGRIPKPLTMGHQTRVWRVGELRAALNSIKRAA